MKRLFFALLISFFSISGNAQKSERNIYPPLGIEWPDLPLAGAPGSQNYEAGIQNVSRTRVNIFGDPENSDATRFLEKAVKENNIENARKLLKVGASAFISYEMIDKKQYEMIDIMYNDNPKLIRFSQLLHYACAKSDAEMIDFLIERKASLDLYGCYLDKGRLLKCKWNNDWNYNNTPADVALYYQKWDNLKHIINKYHKYPTIYGCSLFLLTSIKNDKPNKSNLEIIRSFISNEGEQFQFMKNVDFSMAEILNFGYYSKEGRIKIDYIINETIAKIAESRLFKNNRDKGFLDLLNLLIAKGADVNCQEDNGAGWRAQKSLGLNISNYVNTTPLYVAMTKKDMIDIVKLLRSKGASLTTTANGQKVSILKLPKVLDEYKEYFMLEGIN